jgi:hypothetical protein
MITKVLSGWVGSSLILLLWISSSFAGLGERGLPEEMSQEVFSYLKRRELKAASLIDRESFGTASYVA